MDKERLVNRYKVIDNRIKVTMLNNNNELCISKYLAVFNVFITKYDKWMRQLC